MKHYIGTKFIKAEPMTQNAFFEKVGDAKRAEDNKEGYLVEYEDGYQSWSPKYVFEKAYRELTGTLSTLEGLKVFPSEAATIGVYPDKDYNGAHQYRIQECAGFENGETQYVDTFQVLQFVKKEEDGSMTPGLQSEQVLLALIDRHEKLNARFPSEYNDRMIAGMQEAVDAMQERVEDRMTRGVMGDLKK